MISSYTRNCVGDLFKSFTVVVNEFNENVSMQFICLWTLFELATPM